MIRAADREGAPTQSDLGLHCLLMPLSHIFAWHGRYDVHVFPHTIPGKTNSTKIWLLTYFFFLNCLETSEKGSDHIVRLLTHCRLNELHHIIYLKILILILGMLVYVIYIFLEENGWSICKQWRPRSDATFCGIWSGSALFANYPFKSFQTTMG